MRPSEKVRELRKLSQQFAYTSIQMHETIGKKAGLSGTDHKYLGFFLQKGQMTAGELAVLTGLTTGAVTGLIDRLEKKKFVKRQFDKSDRRKVYIVPDVDRITSLFKPLYNDFQNNSDKLLETFSSSELKVLERYFAGALNIMENKIAALNSTK